LKLLMPTFSHKTTIHEKSIIHLSISDFERLVKRCEVKRVITLQSEHICKGILKLARIIRPCWGRNQRKLKTPIMDTIITNMIFLT